MYWGIKQWKGFILDNIGNRHSQQGDGLGESKGLELEIFE